MSGREFGKLLLALSVEGIMVFGIIFSSDNITFKKTTLKGKFDGKRMYNCLLQPDVNYVNDVSKWSFRNHFCINKFVC